MIWSRVLGALAVAAAIFALGAAVGWHEHTVRDNAAIVKQVVKVSKVEAKDQQKVEKQNDTDNLRIKELQDSLAAARRDAAARGVPVRATHCPVPSTQADAGAGAPASPEREPAGSGEEDYQRLRDRILVAGAVAEQLRLQVLSCQAQWPR